MKLNSPQNVFWNLVLRRLKQHPSEHPILSLPIYPLPSSSGAQAGQEIVCWSAGEGSPILSRPCLQGGVGH